MAVVAITTTMVAGVKYTHTTDSSADWASISNDTYFYDLTTKLVYYKDTTGKIVNSFSGLVYFAESQLTTAPNNTTYASVFTSVGTTTDVDIVLNAKGAGAILASTPNNIAVVPNVGGNKRGIYALDLQHYGTINAGTEVASGAYSAIVAGSRNTASGGSDTVVNGFRNVSSGSYAFTGGGQLNTCSGGYAFLGNGQSNISSSTYSTVINGFGNTASSSYTFAGGISCIASGSRAFAYGDTNTASGAWSVALNGSNTAGADYSTVIGAAAFVGTTWGKFALGGNGPSSGSAQKGALVLVIRTTGNAATELAWGSTGGADARSQMTCQDNQAMRVKGSIIGKQTGSTNVAAWDFDYLIVRGVGVGTTSVVSSNVTVVSNIPGWGTPTITADAAKGFASIKVTGLTATNIQWVATLDSCETLYA